MPFLFLCLAASPVFAQDHKKDTTYQLEAVIPTDSTLRITNLNPYFTIHVDSILSYDLKINRDTSTYFWYIKQGPVGLRLDKNTGNLYFKADKSFFRSGKLRYDVPYTVELGVQNINDPKERVDTSLTIVFYSTEITLSKIKPGVIGTVYAEEGDTVRFRIQCEDGSFPIEKVVYNTNMPITSLKPVNKCDDEFAWAIPFDFIRETDTARQKVLTIQFIGIDKFRNKDTADVKISVKPGINYPQKYQEHQAVNQELLNYITNLKLTFYAMSKTIKSNKSTRTAFDITGSTTALAGTVLATTASNPNVEDLGKIMPSIGLTLVPVKEAVAPNKVQEQNTAAQIRGITKRLEYIKSENALIGDRDPDVLAKTKKLRDEIKQAKLQLVDLPDVEMENISPEDAEKYFNDPKVIKKYKIKVN
jgi:hypothetical protein